MTFNLRSRWKRLGKLDKSFVIGLLLYFILLVFIPASGFVSFLQFLLIVIGAWLVLRLTRVALRKAIWRLRNRLIVAYVLIAVVPILLILTLAGLLAYMLAAQLGFYLVRSELDRRVASMQSVAEALMRAEPANRGEAMRRTGEVFRDRYPGLALAIDDRGSLMRWPEKSSAAVLGGAAASQGGIALRDGLYYCFAHVAQGATQITASIPLTRHYLGAMVPGLGDVFFLQVSPDAPATANKQPAEEQRGLHVTTEVQKQRGITVGGRKIDVLPAGHESASATLPPPVNRFDLDVQWLSLARVVDWVDSSKGSPAVLFLHTRISAIIQIFISQKLDEFQTALPVLLLAVAIAFLVVEMISLVIGVTLTRTITGAVHSLYEGTRRVMEGDFSHRIPASGRDQLADLSLSFNTMTENLERLLAVAKEKERLQAEIEIAREVQEQLYPKITPALKTLQVSGRCQPARMVSGDYFDYQLLAGNRLAIAIGDVAGKGISAALLMATIQAAMRMELRASIELTQAAQVAMNGFGLSTARMVSDLNNQLWATTSAEKFATFCFAIYDEPTGVVTYTNAGHLPPILIRDGRATRLEVNGTVVGAFPASAYDESRLELQSGDLLVCYTDGITEPENEYGEMFGDERLIDLISKNVQQDDARIINTVMDAVHQWSGSAEQPDDMTILLARRK